MGDGPAFWSGTSAASSKSVGRSSLLGRAWSGTIVEENHTVSKKTRTIFLAACYKISSVAQYLVVVTVHPSQEVHQ